MKILLNAFGVATIQIIPRPVFSRSKRWRLNLNRISIIIVMKTNYSSHCCHFVSTCILVYIQQHHLLPVYAPDTHTYTHTAQKHMYIHARTHILYTYIYKYQLNNVRSIRQYCKEITDFVNYLSPTSVIFYYTTSNLKQRRRERFLCIAYLITIHYFTFS